MLAGAYLYDGGETDEKVPYARYAFPYTDFPDYAKLSIWPDAYYITFNMFQGETTFVGARACAFERSQMLIGGPARQQCVQLDSAYGGLLSADLDGAKLPPVGSPTNKVLVCFSRSSVSIIAAE